MMARLPQLVGLPLPGPDHVLVRAGQHLDCLGEIAVAGDRPVVVPIGAGELGQYPRVTRVGLRARSRESFPVARRRQRVHRQTSSVDR